MATAKPPPLPPARRAPLRRRWRRRFAVGAIVLVAALVWFRTPLGGYAAAGAAYGARVACACRFVGGRSLDDCRKDFVPGMALVMLSEDAKAKSVTARIPLISRQTARIREGEGCVLDKWED